MFMLWKKAGGAGGGDEGQEKFLSLLITEVIISRSSGLTAIFYNLTFKK